EAPRGLARLARKERRSIDGHFFFGEFPNGCAGKHRFYEGILVQNHPLAETWCSELLEGFNCCSVKVIPGGHRTDELHESQAFHKFRLARCQVKRQSRSPVVRHNVRG